MSQSPQQTPEGGGQRQFQQAASFADPIGMQGVIAEIDAAARTIVEARTHGGVNADPRVAQDRFGVRSYAVTSGPIDDRFDAEVFGDRVAQFEQLRALQLLIKIASKTVEIIYAFKVRWIDSWV